VLISGSDIMFKKPKTYIILALVILIISGIYYWKSKPKVIDYTTQEATLGTIVRTVSVTGSFEPEEKADLSFKLNGRIESLLVDVGDSVSVGKKIATIDKGTLENDLAGAKHYLNAQRKTLYDMKKRDDIYNGYQRDAQREVIKKAEEAVDAIAKQISETSIYSPLTGIVTKKNVEVGENVTATAVVVTVSSAGAPNVEVDIPESDIIDVALGQKVALTFDALPSEEILEGEVYEIEPASTVIQDVVYYKVKIKLLSEDSRLKLGMSADADINTFEKNDVVMIPYRAVKKDSGQEYVEILKPENLTERVNVKTGVKGDDGMVEIISGLKGGEKIIVLTSEK
jgi:macrolide-specific efflux system membrane fusion protein